MAGALVYAALTFLISAKASLLIQLFMPLVMLATYFFILGKPGKILPPPSKNAASLIQLFHSNSRPPQHSKSDPANDASKPLLGKATSTGTRKEEKEGNDVHINVRAMKLQFFNKEELGKYFVNLTVASITIYTVHMSILSTIALLNIQQKNKCAQALSNFRG